MKTKLLFLLILFAGCSSSVSVTTTRFSGVVLDRSMGVEVGPIAGSDAAEFREELIAALRSQPGFRGGEGRSATLVVEGVYTPTMDESTSSETVDGKTVETVEQVYTATFEYSIIHEETGEEITFGALTESSSDTHEHEKKGFFAAILDAVVDAILSGDPYADLREDLIARFVAEISPRERTVEVTLFEDSDLPGLEQGIEQARVGRWKQALELFLDVIEQHPGHENLHKAYYDAGVAYEYTHQYSLAREFLERALDLSPEPEYEMELRRCIRYEGEWKWREEYLEKIRMIRDEQ